MLINTSDSLASVCPQAHKYNIGRTLSLYTQSPSPSTSMPNLLCVYSSHQGTCMRVRVHT